jgi:hypothetical protein
MEAHCDRILGDPILFDKLKEEKFDVILVDLIFNECALALAHELGKPAVGYWGFPFRYYIFDIDK